MDKELQKLTKKERKDFLKDQSAKAQSSNKIGKHLVRIGILLGILLMLGIGLYLYFRPPTPVPNIGQTYPDIGRTHITQGSFEHEPYNSNPPSSGDHWPTPAKCQVYGETVPDESAVHSLEHGAVWISYRDKDDKDLAKKLKEIADGSGGKILVSPRAENDSAIALVSWGRVLKLEKFDEKKIKDFIRYYRNAAPEATAAC